MQIQGGNWRIFHEMAHSSNATINLNAAVASLSLKPNEPNSPDAKYRITTTKTGSSEASTPEEYPVLFDNVVVATPWQFSDIATSEGMIQHAVDEVPYMRLHVTLFASPFRISPNFLNLFPGQKIPTTILTTLAETDEAKAGPAGAGKAGFYSISTLRKVINPKSHKEEFLYKIFSPEAVTPEFLSRLLGAPIPETFTAAEKKKPSADDATFVDPISWYYPHIFYSYPLELPRVTFQDPILRGGLYYTSGIESFISTMETSALMGMNVARLIADDFLGIDREAELAKEQASSRAEEVSEL
jgi:prenylcysteine oxidase / farnesylcysteine lyase